MSQRGTAGAVRHVKRQLGYSIKDSRWSAATADLETAEVLHMTT